MEPESEANQDSTSTSSNSSDAGIEAWNVGLPQYCGRLKSLLNASPRQMDNVDICNLALRRLVSFLTEIGYEISPIVWGMLGQVRAWSREMEDKYNPRHVPLPNIYSHKMLTDLDVLLKELKKCKPIPYNERGITGYTIEVNTNPPLPVTGSDGGAATQTNPSAFYQQSAIESGLEFNEYTGEMQVSYENPSFIIQSNEVLEDTNPGLQIHELNPISINAIPIGTEGTDIDESVVQLCGDDLPPDDNDDEEDAAITDEDQIKKKINETWKKTQNMSYRLVEEDLSIITSSLNYLGKVLSCDVVSDLEQLKHKKESEAREKRNKRNQELNPFDLDPKKRYKIHNAANNVQRASRPTRSTSSRSRSPLVSDMNLPPMPHGHSMEDIARFNDLRNLRWQDLVPNPDRIQIDD